MSNTELRPVAEGDRGGWDALWRAYLEFYGIERPAEQYDATWQRIMNPSEPMYSMVAVSGGEHRGLVNFLYHRTFWEAEDKCYLQDLYVVPRARGGGLGGELIRAVERHASDRGSSGVYWLTAEDNRTARRLYDRVASLSPFVRYVVP